MSKFFAMSPLGMKIKNKQDEKEPLFRVEIKDLARGFCGALFLAVPLHFTMEMWERARAISSTNLIIIILFAYLANVGFNMFTSYKEVEERRTIFLDALTAMGIGFLAASITMIFTNQVSLLIPLETTLKVITLEMVPTSFGASLAVSQLGGGSSDSRYSADVRKVIGSTLGAIMFSFNIAATAEPILISYSLLPWQLIGLVVLSLFVSFLMVFIAGFVDREPDEGGVLGRKWVETAVTYIISLIVSASLLWMFGYVTIDTPLSMSLPWIVVLGYATTLGSSAGRLVI